MNDQSDDAEGQRAGGAPRRDGAPLAPLRIGSRRGDRPHTALTSARRIGCHSSCRILRILSILRLGSCPGTVLSSWTVADERSRSDDSERLGSITCHIDLLDVLLPTICIHRCDSCKDCRTDESDSAIVSRPEVSIDYRQI